jgi:dipeptidyl aminopeptidase/acylaminoacyl peptidase
LWIEHPESGERRALTPADRTVWSFSWAPDGESLAVQTTASPQIDHSYMFRELGTVSIAGGDLTLLTETPGKLAGMAWSPDGSKLAFVGAVSANDPLAQSVFILPAGGGAAVNRTAGYGGSVAWLGWTDNRTVVFLANEGTKTTVNRVDTRSGGMERVAGYGSEILGSISFDRGMQSFAAVASTASYPAEVHVGTLGSRTIERITWHNTWLENVELARQGTIEWTHPDGTRIEGVLLQPLREQPGVRQPLVILPHGGPEGVSQDGWTTRGLYPAQVLAAQGYMVLLPNYRGSAGRGVAFSKADHRDLGGKEFEDVIAGIDHLAAQGLVDPERVGSSGTSYGGYFSAWAGTRHSDRFSAAITFAGITNWASFTGTTDIPYEMSIVHWDFWWFDNPGVAWDRSPLAHANEYSSPILVMHGAVDERVHPEQSLELYQALKLQGVPTGLVIYPREPHGLRERAHQLDFMRRVIQWFDQHVKRGEPTT